MEIWYNLVTLEVKAVYSDRYTGSVWQDAGWVNFENDTVLVPRDLMPGAIANFDGSEPIVTTPAPVPIPDPREVRIKGLIAKLKVDTITDVELRELWRLERRL